MVTGTSSNLLREQKALADSLQRLGMNLRRHQRIDLDLTTETVVAAVQAIRIWLESGMALAVVRTTSRERLEEWESELLEGAKYLNALRAFIHEDLHMSLRERNLWRVDLGQKRSKGSGLA